MGFPHGLGKTQRGNQGRENEGQALKLGHIVHFSMLKSFSDPN